MIRISQLAASVKPSATLAAGAKARQLKAAGVKVFDFSLGEPDFNTPKHICDAADEGRARRPDALHARRAAPPRCKAAICRWYKAVPRLRVRARERDRLQRGEALDPQRPRRDRRPRRRGHHPDAVLGQLLRPREHDRARRRCWSPTTPESGFKMTPAQLKAAITPQTRLLMLNSPCNPTGTVYTRAELEALADTLRRQQRRGDPQRRDLRAAHLRRREADLLRDAAAGPDGPDDHDQRGEQELRHDRLADGLDGRPGGRRQGDGHDPEPGDELPVERRPGGARSRRWTARRSASPRCGRSSPPAAT